MILQTMTATLLFLQTAGGSISGTVVDSTTGQPIADARIEINSLPPLSTPPQTAGTSQTSAVSTFRPARIPPASSDAAGHFTSQNLELGRYLARAFKEGFSDTTIGTASADSTIQVTLSENEASKNLTFRLTPGAAISGQVIGPDARPVAGMEVGTFVSRYDSDGRQIFQLSTFANTDDRGEYRIFPAPPGQYYLSVGPPSRPILTNRLITPFNNPKNAFLRLFYPGTTDPSAASLIDVRPRAEISGMNFRISEQATFRIRGRVVDTSTGRIPDNVGISIQRRDSNIVTNSTSSGNIINPSDGSFELQNIAPGRYIVLAQTALSIRLVAVQAGVTGGAAAPAPPSAAPGVAIAEVEVTSRDVDGVVLAFGPPLTISGKLQMQNGSPVPDGMRVNIAFRSSSLLPLSNGPKTPHWTANGSFTIDGVTPGEYFVSITPLPTGNASLPYVRDVRAGEVDLLVHSMVAVGPRTDEIVITLGQNGGVVSGTVSRTSAEATDRVVLVPSDRSLRSQYKMATLASNGGFTLRGVAPGTYTIFAIGGAADGAPWFDPAYLSAIEGSGTPVSLSDSANVSVNLNLIRRP